MAHEPEGFAFVWRTGAIDLCQQHARIIVHIPIGPHIYLNRSRKYATIVSRKHESGRKNISIMLNWAKNILLHGTFCCVYCA